MALNLQSQEYLAKLLAKENLAVQHGNYSTASGFYSCATGFSSSAFGGLAKAIGDHSSTFGKKDIGPNVFTEKRKLTSELQSHGVQPPQVLSEPKFNPSHSK